MKLFKYDLPTKGKSNTENDISSFTYMQLRNWVYNVLDNREFKPQPITLAHLTKTKGSNPDVYTSNFDIYKVGLGLYNYYNKGTSIQLYGDTDKNILLRLGLDKYLYMDYYTGEVMGEISRSDVKKKVPVQKWNLESEMYKQAVKIFTSNSNNRKGG